MECVVDNLKIKRRAKVRKIIKNTAIYAALTVNAAFFMFLYFFMFFKSVMGNSESLGNPMIRFFPTVWNFSNYRYVFDAAFLRYTLNTLLVAAVTMIGVPLACSLCAFGFSRCGKFRGREFWFAATLATMMLPGVVVQVPLYVLFKNLGMIGNLSPLIIPPLFGGGAGNIFLMRQFMRTLPKELDEAAYIDGANKLAIYFRIILPLCIPIIIFVMVGCFTTAWNDFTSALLYVRQERWYTLAQGIYFKFMVSGSEFAFPNIKMATGVVMVIPVALLFFIFQKQLINGVVMTGVKG